MGSYLTVIFHSRSTETSLNGLTLLTDVTIIRLECATLMVGFTTAMLRILYIEYISGLMCYRCQGGRCLWFDSERCDCTWSPRCTYSSGFSSLQLMLRRTRNRVVQAWIVQNLFGAYRWRKRWFNYSTSRWTHMHLLLATRHLKAYDGKK